MTFFVLREMQNLNSVDQSLGCSSWADVAIDFFAVYTTASTLNAFNGLDNPTNCPFPLGIWTPI